MTPRRVRHGLLGLLVLLAGCSSRPAETLALATTTSTQDSGLLDLLLPLFRAKTGIVVKATAVGSGQALALGRRGDADVLLVHDPAAEARFMTAGHGALRRTVMHNDFLLVGPPADPAGAQARPITEAFARIARSNALFISRGDESGTHKKEQAVWREAALSPRGDWYIRAGAGMGQVLRMAGEKRAYALTDRGTFLALRDGLGLVPLSEGGSILTNPYSVIIVNPERHPHVRFQAALRFADFLKEPETRAAIRGFGIDRFGQPLFIPSEATRVQGVSQRQPGD